MGMCELILWFHWAPPCAMYRQSHRHQRQRQCLSAIFTYYKPCYSSAAVVQTATLTGPGVWAGRTMTPCQIPAAWWRLRVAERTRRKYTKRSAGKSHFKFTPISSYFCEQMIQCLATVGSSSGLYPGYQELSVEKPGVGRCCLHCSRSYRGKLLAVDLHNSIWSKIFILHMRMPCKKWWIILYWKVS